MFSTCKFRIIVIKIVDNARKTRCTGNVWDVCIHFQYEEELIKLRFSFSHSRAEGLATEIKELQGQLADYNTVITQN